MGPACGAALCGGQQGEKLSLLPSAKGRQYGMAVVLRMDLMPPVRVVLVSLGSDSPRTLVAACLVRRRK